IGTQHGRQLGPQIRTLREKYIAKLINTAPARLAACGGAALFRAKLLPAHAAEVAALADAANIEPLDAMLAQCFLDLMPITACSTVALPQSASPDHVARLGRNLDFMTLGVADKHTVVLVIHPQDRFAFASVAWPGVIGVLSGMNQHGLCVANMEVTRGVRLPVAM